MSPNSCGHSRHQPNPGSIWPNCAKRGTAILIKGILHPEDAERARQEGADGIIVSNHGGRQLDRAVASLDALPAVRNAVGPDYPVLLDSGVRRGSDIAIGLCLGADFVFCGRAMLYGAVAHGEQGVRRSISILGEELLTVMGQIGATRVADLRRELIVAAD
ncbi:alpha-hydroxy acid oxidase [Mesorhizobium sp. SB112]|uniref:alpha-hydroxy acid oxidase n=1 Tax=Mesorhizobium sp. SB112 TaxID=3151853 RepID=UPI003264E880